MNKRRHRINDNDNDPGHAHPLNFFAVALLDNHFHIYLRTPEPNLSDGMRMQKGSGVQISKLAG